VRDGRHCFAPGLFRNASHYTATIQQSRYQKEGSKVPYESYLQPRLR
jgi:hypothetical protein